MRSLAEGLSPGVSPGVYKPRPMLSAGSDRFHETSLQDLCVLTFVSIAIAAFHLCPFHNLKLLIIYLIFLRINQLIVRWSTCMIRYLSLESSKAITQLKSFKFLKFCYQMFTGYTFRKQKRLYTLPYIFNRVIILNAERFVFVAEKKSV